MRSIFWTLFLSGATLSVAGHADAGPIVNGTFETGNFTGWTTTGDVNVGNEANIQNAGAYSAYFNAGDKAPNGTISQTFATTVGAEYDVSFPYGALNTPQSIIANWIDLYASRKRLSRLYITLTTLAILSVAAGSVIAAELPIVWGPSKGHLGPVQVGIPFWRLSQDTIAGMERALKLPAGSYPLQEYAILFSRYLIQPPCCRRIFCKKLCRQPRRQTRHIHQSVARDHSGRWVQYYCAPLRRRHTRID